MTDFTPFPDDSLSSKGFFESHRALFKSINAYARPRGYAFTTQRSIRDPSGLKVFYACDRSRRLSDDIRIREGKRKTTTRMTECPFSVLAKETRNGWALKHRPGVRHALYNHEPSLHPSAHPVHRQLSYTPELKSLSNAGFAPKEIQTVVRERGSLTIRQDIYNRIAEVR